MKILINNYCHNHIEQNLNKNYYLIKINNKFILTNNIRYYIWGLGIGDWGLGIKIIIFLKKN